MGWFHKTTPSEFGTCQTCPMPRAFCDGWKIVERASCNRMNFEQPHDSLQNLAAKVLGQALRDSRNSFGSRPAYNSILADRKWRDQVLTINEAKVEWRTLSWRAENICSRMPSISSGTSISSCSSSFTSDASLAKRVRAYWYLSGTANIYYEREDKPCLLMLLEVVGSNLKPILATNFVLSFRMIVLFKNVDVCSMTWTKDRSKVSSSWTCSAEPVFVTSHRTLNSPIA